MATVVNTLPYRPAEAMRYGGLRAGQVRVGTTFTAAGSLPLPKATPIM